ncbi:MAG: hypothetical protein AB7F19_07520 [Candidatus Babeliales bacterium]
MHKIHPDTRVYLIRSPRENNTEKWHAADAWMTTNKQEAYFFVKLGFGIQDFIFDALPDNIKKIIGKQLVVCGATLHPADKRDPLEIMARFIEIRKHLKD